jgi:molecular chaperone DnaK
VREVLESDDAAEIRGRTEALQGAFHKVSEAMYERVQADQAAAGGDGAGPNGATGAAAEDEEEVVDAEIVDEGRK